MPNGLVGSKTRLSVTAESIDIENEENTKASVSVKKLLYCSAVRMCPAKSPSASISSEKEVRLDPPTFVSLDSAEGNSPSNEQNPVLFALALKPGTGEAEAAPSAPKSNADVLAFACKQPSSAFALVQACSHAYLHHGNVSAQQPAIEQKLDVDQDVKIEMPMIDAQVAAPQMSASVPSVEVGIPKVEEPQLSATIPSLSVDIPQAEVDVTGGADTDLSAEIFGALDSDANLEATYNVPSAAISTGVTSIEMQGQSPDLEIDLPKIEAKSVIDVGATPALAAAASVDMTPLEAKTDSGIDLDLDLPELPLKDDAMVVGPELGLSPYAEVQEKKGGFGLPKFPDIKIPSLSLSGSSKSVDVPSVDASLDAKCNVEPVTLLKASSPDIKTPSVEGDITVEKPDLNLSATAPSVDLKMPRIPSVKLPSVNLSMPKIGSFKKKAPKLDVEVPKLDVEANLPPASLGADVAVASPSLAVPDASLELSAPSVDVEPPTLSTDLPEASMDVSLEAPSILPPSASLDLSPPSLDINAPDKDVEVDKPSFSMPSFSIFGKCLEK